MAKTAMQEKELQEIMDSKRMEDYILSTYEQRKQEKNAKIRNRKEQVPVLKAKVEHLQAGMRDAMENGNIDEYSRLSAELETSRTFLAKINKTIRDVNAKQYFTDTEAESMAAQIKKEYAAEDLAARKELAELTERMEQISRRMAAKYNHANTLLFYLGHNMNRMKGKKFVNYSIDNEAAIIWGGFMKGLAPWGSEKWKMQNAYQLTKQGK